MDNKHTETHSLKFVQAAGESDAGTIAALAREIWTEHFIGMISARQVEYMLDKLQSKSAVLEQINSQGYKYYLVQCEQEYIGYFAFIDRGEDVFISKFYLLKSFRGRGIFSKMLDFITDYAQRHGIFKLFLMVNKHNDSAISIYSKKGFKIHKEMVNDIGSGFSNDDYLLLKILGV